MSQTISIRIFIFITTALSVASIILSLSHDSSELLDVKKSALDTKEYTIRLKSDILDLQTQVDSLRLEIAKQQIKD
jgi:cell division protein FtsL